MKTVAGVAEGIVVGLAGGDWVGTSVVFVGDGLVLGEGVNGVIVSGPVTGAKEIGPLIGESVPKKGDCVTGISVIGTCGPEDGVARLTGAAGGIGATIGEGKELGAKFGESIGAIVE